MNPIYNIFRPFAKIISNYPEMVLKMRYKRAFGKKIDLTNPRDMFEKIFWMSLNTDTSLWTQLADKYKVREWVAEKCSNEILTNLYAVYDSAKEINFEELPNTFVIKTNNGCASNFLVKDKSKFDTEELRSNLDYWMKFPYGELTGQKHYTRIEPKIIVEEYLIDDKYPNVALIDYKFECFNGEPHYCNVFRDRVFNTHKVAQNLYDMDWNAYPDYLEEDIIIKDSCKPKCFDEMINIVRILSNGFKYVRVDLYEVNDKIKFGEMTFMPGLNMGFKENIRNMFGDMIIL